MDVDIAHIGIRARTIAREVITMRDADGRRRCRLVRIFARRLVQESRLLSDTSKDIIEESLRTIERARALSTARRRHVA